MHLPRLQPLHILLLHRGLIALDNLLADSPRLLRRMDLFAHRCARLCMCCRAVWLEFTDRKDNVEDALLTLCSSAAHIAAYRPSGLRPNETISCLWLCYLPVNLILPSRTPPSTSFEGGLGVREGRISLSFYPILSFTCVCECVCAYACECSCSGLGSRGRTPLSCWRDQAATTAATPSTSRAAATGRNH